MATRPDRNQRPLRARFAFADPFVKPNLSRIPQFHASGTCLALSQLFKRCGDMSNLLATSTWVPYFSIASAMQSKAVSIIWAQCNPN